MFSRLSWEMVGGVRLLNRRNGRVEQVELELGSVTLS